MLSIHNFIRGVCGFKAFSSFFWCRTKDKNSCKVWRRSFGWGWVNHHHQHSRKILANSSGGTGNTGDPAEFSSNFPLHWDPFEDMFGLGVDRGSRKNASKQQSKQKYELEMPCPTCEGRGYLFCPHCKFRKSEAACQLCSGRGYHDCPQCHGECVVWDDSLNETAWASLHSRFHGIYILTGYKEYTLCMQNALVQNLQERSSVTMMLEIDFSSLLVHIRGPSSPLQTAEDDAIENMAITSTPKRKTRRVYGPPSPETREKIRRALKDLEARTGSISRRMKTINQDPILYAQRTAAIKKARGTDEARKVTSNRLKEYFKSPENRLKHSQSMRGVRFTCTACGEEGHRRHFCPKLGFKSKKTQTSRPYSCSFCGQNGHGCRRCPERQKLDSSSLVTTTYLDGKIRQERPPKVYRCGVCHTLGHTKSTCPTLKPSKRLCRICGQAGHNSQTCSAPVAKDEN